MATERHHRKLLGERREAPRQRIPKVGHQDFTVHLLVQFRYPVRMWQLLNIINNTFPTERIYDSRLISNVIYIRICVYPCIVWNYNRFENEIISEAVRTDADTCKATQYFTYLCSLSLRVLEHEK